MSDFITRMREEKAALDEKGEKLSDFIIAPGGVYSTLSADDRTLLDAQLAVMSAYLRILSRRIERAEAAAQEKTS